MSRSPFHGAHGNGLSRGLTFTGLPVYENAAYRLEEHGWSEEEIERAVKEALRFVGLDGEEEKFPEGFRAE